METQTEIQNDRSKFTQSVTFLPVDIAKRIKIANIFIEWGTLKSFIEKAIIIHLEKVEAELNIPTQLAKKEIETEPKEVEKEVETNDSKAVETNDSKAVEIK